MNSYFQFNKLSHLHNGKNIFFCKTDYRKDDFAEIKSLDHNVILITGNSDYPITDDIVSQSPKNIKRWYATNAISNSLIIEPIPIGLENKEQSQRNGHGIGYGDRVREKENCISSIDTGLIPEKLVYANFNCDTNPSHRNYLKKIIQNISYITHREPILSIQEFFKDLENHKMVLCPIGNGIDTHRLWETLYCNRVPIIIRHDKYKIYELYDKLPIIVLNSIDELIDPSLLMSKHEAALQKKDNLFYLNINYWIQKIIDDCVTADSNFSNG